MTAPPGPDNPSTLLHTAYLYDDVTRLGGFHRELFLREFSILEEALIICTICQGVKQDASMYQGLTTCRVCSGSPDRSTEVQDITELVSRLTMRCPLFTRGCIWKGSVADAELHVHSCKELLLVCPSACGAGITRGRMEKHVEACAVKETACEYCGSVLSAKCLDEHLTTCKDWPVSCQLCSASVKRSQLDEHVRVSCEKSQIERNQAKPEDTKELGVQVHRQQENILEQLLSEKLTNLENETVHLKERVSCLERRNGVLTKALFSKPELCKYDSCTGRILEGFKWPILGIEHLTKIVSTVESPSFYISHHNLRLVANIGMLNAISFTATRMPGSFDEIVESGTLCFYRCEVVGVREGTEPFVKSERVNHHQLKLGEKSQPFGFIDVSIVRDPAFCADDSITLLFYFDLLH